MKLTDEQLAYSKQLYKNGFDNDYARFLFHIDAITAERDEAMKKQANFQKVVKMQKSYIHNLKNSLTSCSNGAKDYLENFTKQQDEILDGYIIRNEELINELCNTKQTILHQSAVNMALAKRLAAVEKKLQESGGSWVPFLCQEVQIGDEVKMRNGSIGIVSDFDVSLRMQYPITARFYQDVLVFALSGQYDIASGPSDKDLTHMRKPAKGA